MSAFIEWKLSSFISYDSMNADSTIMVVWQAHDTYIYCVLLLMTVYASLPNVQIISGREPVGRTL